MATVVQIVPRRVTDSVQEGGVNAIRVEAKDNKFVYFKPASDRFKEGSQEYFLGGNKPLPFACVYGNLAFASNVTVDASATYFDIYLPFSSSRVSVRYDEVATDNRCILVDEFEGYLGLTLKETITVGATIPDSYNFTQEIDRIRVKWSNVSEGLAFIYYLEIILDRDLPISLSVPIERRASLTLNDEAKVSYSFICSDKESLNYLARKIDYGIRIIVDRPSGFSYDILSSDLYVERFWIEGEKVIMEGKAWNGSLDLPMKMFFSRGDTYWLRYVVNQFLNMNFVDAVHSSWSSPKSEYIFPLASAKETIEQMTKEGGLTLSQGLFTKNLSKWVNALLLLPGETLSGVDFSFSTKPITSGFEASYEPMFSYRKPSDFFFTTFCQTFKAEEDIKIEGAFSSVLETDLRTSDGDYPVIFPFSDGKISFCGSGITGSFIKTFSVKKQDGEFLFYSDTEKAGRLEALKKQARRFKFLEIFNIYDWCLTPGQVFSFSDGEKNYKAIALSVEYALSENDYFTEIEGTILEEV